MTLNPLNELKRRLDDDKTPLPKRLCLAKNIVQSHHFPTAPKERIVAEWLHTFTEKNKLKGEELKNVLDWLSTVDDLTSDLKSEMIQIVSQYVQRSPLQGTDIQYISTFLENAKIYSQLSLQIDDYLTITITLLQNLRINENISHSRKIFNNFIKFYRESKKKLEFIIKLLNGENIETIFTFLDTECRSTVLDLCQNILFPISKRSYFISFLQTLIRKDNLEELIAEKGDNIQSVIKIMNTFFEFPKNRSDNDPKFLHNFVDVFVSSFKNENQIVFAFYIMVANVLNMEQSFIIPAMNLPCILQETDAKIKRVLFLNMLEVLQKNEIDINVRLTDTFGEKISKVEIKKNFTSFLQAVMMGQLKLQGKPDKTTLLIIKTALKLDPVLIEQKIKLILPPIMAVKKNSSTLVYYIEMMNCLLAILFKLSRGTLFINEILPPVKNVLEACNTEQFELKTKLKDTTLESQLINGRDILPSQCVAVYGKLTSELMFRQNKELLESLQKNLEVHCLMMLEEGFVSPSIITLTQVLASILSSFLDHNKMADHTVPQNIAQDFWEMYTNFENECLSKFGECILKLSFDPALMDSFLSLCTTIAKLKLLNIKYSNVKLPTMQLLTEKYTSEAMDTDNTLEACDLSMLLPCLNSQQWNAIAQMCEEFSSEGFNHLLLTKALAIDLATVSNQNQFRNEQINTTKEYLIQKCIQEPQLIESNYYYKTLLRNLDNSHSKLLAKSLVKLFLSQPTDDCINILEHECIINNKYLLSILVLQSAKNITKCFDNEDKLTKALNKSDFNMAAFAKDVDINNYFNNLTLKPDTQDTIKTCLKIFKKLPLSYLEENYQLVAIFVMLATKKCSSVKKTKRTIDNILRSIYELSVQRPDLYQIFPADAIFNLKDGILLDLLTLKINTSNNMLIIKSLLELAVKKVRADSDQVKGIVEKLLKKSKKKSSSMESFKNPVFQITCLILPLIVKQKKAITSSAFRSILADLQEKLNASLLESFKNVEFSNLSFNNAGNPDDSLVDNDDNMAILNAMAAYSLTLSKYCETTDAEDIKKLDCLWSGLEFFVNSAIKSIEKPESKPPHIESAIQLLNVILRHIKKLETHPIFQEKDKIFLTIWRSIKSKLLLEPDLKLNGSILEDIGVTLKFVCEAASVECFATHFVGDLASLVVLKKPNLIIKSDNTDIKSRKVFKYLWSQCLKANIVGQKCVAIAKLMHRTCKNLRNWMRQHYETESVARFDDEVATEVKIIKVDDLICELIRLDLDSLCEILLAAKKVSLDYKFLDNIFELQHLIHYVIGVKNFVRCEISSQAFNTLFEGCVAVLNTLLVAREEVIEDRWPCYMQCYRALTTSLCERSSSHSQPDPLVEDKLAELAHSIEKLTQSITKRKKHVSRIAAYTVADLCTSLEKSAPIKKVRQHIENAVAMLIQASDSTYAMAFLKRALVGSPGQMTMTGLYTMYKRYHKYVGNA